MTYTLKLLSAVALASAVTLSMAAPADQQSDTVPPAHRQKNQVPDSTRNGNYLEPQQDNNNDTISPAAGNEQPRNQPSKAGNMEKSKRFHEKPADGGTGVKQP